MDTGARVTVVSSDVKKEQSKQDLYLYGDLDQWNAFIAGCFWSSFDGSRSEQFKSHYHHNPWCTQYDHRWADSMAQVERSTNARSHVPRRS